MGTNSAPVDQSQQVVIDIFVKPKGDDLSGAEYELLQSMAHGLLTQVRHNVRALTQLPLTDDHFVANCEASTFDWTPNIGLALEARVVLPDLPSYWLVTPLLENRLTEWARAQVYGYKNTCAEPSAHPLTVAILVVTRNERVVEAYGEEPVTFVKGSEHPKNPKDDHDPRGHHK